ncbi:MAG TPA: hypothetical protein PLA68_09330 [Panacibacter sp.]|nr:hypothetical protein [Panacibacter sp.]
MKHLFNLMTCIGFSLVLNAQSGTLDQSFGDSGKMYYDSTKGDCSSVVVQQDGKIITGGQYGEYDLLKYGYIIARFNSDGSIDAGFGHNGQVLLTSVELGNIASHFNVLKLQPDGKILGCGYLNASENTDICVFRLNTNGTLDSSFSDNGVAIFDIGIGDVPGDMALQNDGKIVVTGKKGCKRK